jgi:WD40 repeat protein
VLAAAAFRRLRFTGVADGKEVKGWTPPAVSARWLGFTPGGKTVWVSDDHRLREWDPVAGKWLREAPVAVDYRDPVWSADGKRMACVFGDTVVFLDPTTWKVLNADAVDAGLTDHNFDIVVSPDGKTIATDGAVIRLWDAATGKQLVRVNGVSGYGANLAFLPDSKSFLMVPTADVIAECDARTGKELRRFTTPADLTGKVRFGHLRLLAGGKELAAFAHGSPDYRVRWDLATGKETARFKSPDNRLESEGYRVRSPDDQWLALGGTLYRAEDYPDKPTVEVLDRQAGTGCGACWSPDGTLVTFGKEEKGKEREKAAGCSLVVYDVNKKAVQAELPTGWVGEAAFSPDGKRLGVLTPTGVAVWDLAAGKSVFRVDATDGRALAFTPDGKRLVTAHGTTALVWDVPAAR